MRTREFIQEAALTPQVRAALHRKALRVQARAQTIAARSGKPQFGRSLRVVDDVRPGTKAQGFRRPVSTVTGSHAKGGKEARGGRWEKYKLLLRAAREVG